MKILISFILLFAAHTASAEVIIVKPYLVNGEQGLTDDEAASVLAWGGKIWNDFLPIQLGFKPPKRINTKCTYQKVSSFQNFQTIACIQDQLRERLRLLMPSIVIFPPLKDKDVYLFAGQAYLAVAKRVAKANIAIAFCARWSSHTPPKLRDYACAVIVAHELLHLFGCTHQPGISIMSEATGRYVDQYRDKLQITEQTIAEFNKHMAWVNRLLIRQARQQLRECKTARCRATQLAVLRYRNLTFYRGKK